jgi:hypothetical protein
MVLHQRTMSMKASGRPIDDEGHVALGLAVSRGKVADVFVWPARERLQRRPVSRQCGKMC